MRSPKGNAITLHPRPGGERRLNALQKGLPFVPDAANEPLSLGRAEAGVGEHLDEAQDYVE
jgi:hypothetical protein